jgi:hypothetical protein
VIAERKRKASAAGAAKSSADKSRSALDDKIKAAKAKWADKSPEEREAEGKRLAKMPSAIPGMGALAFHMSYMQEVLGVDRRGNLKKSGLFSSADRLVKAGKYSHINFKPPQSVASAAARGLAYRRKASPSNRGGLTVQQAAAQGIGSGVQRATSLKNRSTLSPATIKRMVSFFARHAKNKAVGAENKGTPWNDKGYVAWLLWGGDAGRAWANKILRQMQAAD